MASGYYLAPALVRCRGELNTSYPSRDRTSDGWIGDAAHWARASDHVPDPRPDGVVRAIDVDRDGIDPMALVAAAIAHPSTNYVIFNGSIWSRAYGFRRRVYTGSNKHEHHVHISILHTRAAEASAASWLPTLLAGATVTEHVQEDDMGYADWPQPQRDKLLNDIKDYVLTPFFGPSAKDADVVGRLKRIDAATGDDLVGRLRRIDAATGDISELTATSTRPGTDALAAAVAAAIPADLADRVINALTDRLATAARLNQ